ncbi:MAG TPA: ATP-binding cassette domain-containing protein, partial [Bacteroidetes bacterium]|nr:ATP-binding cassette domain-containing protein [Bacteroidota bacterium]
HLTARENIWFGDITRPPLEQDIRKAASGVGADVFLESLPKGYNTILGNWFEGSKQLSIGEWQKLSLARAFYRDAGLVILDEPMTSMDVTSEAEIIERFRRLIQGRSAVLISHRFTTVRLADRIYYLEDGHVLEQGSHAELLEQGGRYAKLFTTQAGYYR